MCLLDVQMLRATCPLTVRVAFGVMMLWTVMEVLPLTLLLVLTSKAAMLLCVLAYRWRCLLPPAYQITHTSQAQHKRDQKT